MIGFWNLPPTECGTKSAGALPHSEEGGPGPAFRAILRPTAAQASQRDPSICPVAHKTHKTLSRPTTAREDTGAGGGGGRGASGRTLLVLWGSSGPGEQLSPSPQHVKPRVGCDCTPRPPRHRTLGWRVAPPLPPHTQRPQVPGSRPQAAAKSVWRLRLPFCEMGKSLSWVPLWPG